MRTLLLTCIILLAGANLQAQERMDTLMMGDEIFTIVEDPAHFEGGIGNFYRYLQQNLQYPEKAQELGIEGRVFVQFIVETTGEITDVQVVKGIGAGCDEEAVRVLQNSPKWIPGYQRGVAVRQKMIQNILFKFTSYEGGVAVTSNAQKPVPKPDYIGATFQGGHLAYNKFLNNNKKNVKEPLLPNKYKNHVKIRFEVGVNGSLSNLEVVESLGKGYDQEALRLFSEMPNWIPAKKDGKPISSEVHGAVSFDPLNLNRYAARKEYRKGTNFFEEKRYERALGSFSKAIGKNPNEKDFYFNRALTFLKLERRDEACIDLQLIRDLDSEAMELYENECSK